MDDKARTYNSEVIKTINALGKNVMGYKNALMESIMELAKEGQIVEIGKVNCKAEKVDNFFKMVEEWTLQWRNITEESNTMPKHEGNMKEEVFKRTNWEISGANIRVKTQGAGGSSSNIFSIQLFKKIALSAVDIIEKKGYVKTSDVQEVLHEVITALSRYKQSSWMPVYKTFMVLIKESKFRVDENNSRKYVLNVSRTSFITWLDSIR